MANMTVDNKCIPWYYPQLDPDTRMCSPFEAKEFNKKVDIASTNLCKVCSYAKWQIVIMTESLQHCLPDCEETKYTTTVSAAPFRPCDFRNLGMSPMCDLSPVLKSVTGKPEVMDNVETQPPTLMWGSGVMDKYRKVTTFLLRICIK